MKLNEIWLIAVTAGKWQSNGIREARGAGLKVLALDADPNAEGFKDANLFLNIDLNNYDTVIREILALDINIHGVVSFASEAGVLLAAHIREYFNLPGPKLNLCKRLVNKELQRKLWSESGVPGPRWTVIKEGVEVNALRAEFDFPIIIKPTDSSGSRGVTKIESDCDDLPGAIKLAFKYSGSGTVIVEEFMVGTEFTVETFAHEGKTHVLAITEKKKVDGTRGTVAYELATSDRSPEIKLRIVEAVTAAFHALEYVEGPGHAEIILKNDESVGLVEVAGRGGGFMVFDGLVPTVSGVNVALLTALQAVGLPIGEIIKSEKSAVLRFVPSKPGILICISGFEQANLICGIKAETFAKVGNRYYQASVDGDRFGYILSCAETAPEAQKLADQAEQLITFEMKDEIDY